MGMMNQMAAPQEMPQEMPQGGMMQGAEDPNKASRFNGVIQSDEGPIEVRDGIAQVGGDVYFVSDDGMIVVDKNQNIVGVIRNGKVQQVTPEIADQLKQQGLVR